MHSEQAVTAFELFYREELPRRLMEGYAPLAAEAAAGLPSLAIALADSEAGFTLVPTEDSVRIESGTRYADTCVVLDFESWQGLVDDLESAPGLLYGGRVQCRGGDLTVFVRWEPALRAMLHGRPLYRPDAVQLLDRHGRELDPRQSYTLSASDAELKDFLDAAGYLVVNQVFSDAELQCFREAADTLRKAARPGDQQSWWGRNKDDEEICNRVLRAGVHPAFSGLYDDPRIRRLGALIPEAAHPCDPFEQDGVTIIFKQPGIREGLGDLPWHRDCGMGGHARMCPTVVVSIYLYDATDTSGALRFLPGSHRASFGFLDAADPTAPTGVAAPAKAGGVTLHYSDVMHCAPAPTANTGPYRQSVLLSFKPDYQHHRGERHYNDVLLQRQDGQVEHLDKLVTRRNR